MKLELFLCWCSLALQATSNPMRDKNHGEPNPAGPEFRSPPAGARGAAAWWPLGPHRFVPRPQSSGGSCAAASAWTGPVWGSFVVAVGCGILGTRSPRPCLGGSSGSGAVPSAFPLAHGGCLIYCSLLGNGQGGELAFLGAALLSFPKKSAFPLSPLPWLPGQWETPLGRLLGPLVA